jgi:hypothetical protein
MSPDHDRFREFDVSVRAHEKQLACLINKLASSDRGPIRPYDCDYYMRSIHRCTRALLYINNDGMVVSAVGRRVARGAGDGWG